MFLVLAYRGRACYNHVGRKRDSWGGHLTPKLTLELIIGLVALASSIVNHFRIPDVTDLKAQVKAEARLAAATVVADALIARAQIVAEAERMSMQRGGQK
jgi:hypothetical protein